jgi:macrolide transport system ATP-binding/permease protein
MIPFISKAGSLLWACICNTGEELRWDVIYAVRMMDKNRALTVLAALTLALGIGANIAIYSVMDAILLRSLPVRDPSSLVLVKWHSKPIRENTGSDSKPTHVMHDMSGDTENDPKLGLVAGIFPFPAFKMIQENNTVFSSVFAYRETRAVNVMVQGQAEINQGEYVSGDYFRGLGVRPAAGRLITADDDKWQAPVVSVVSFAFSQAHYGGAANAIGQKISVNNVAVTVVGVAPPEFFGVNPEISPDFYLPFHANVLVEAANPYGTRKETYFAENEYWVEMMAQVTPGVTLAHAQASLAPQFHHWVESTATNDEERANLPELLLEEGAGGVESLRRRYSMPLYILMILVGIILAIACTNIANLLLARSTARRGEMALRLSLGAGRWRLIRQMLTESMVLAFLGGALGVLFAHWCVPLLNLLLTNGNEQLILRASVNGHVLLVALALSVLTGLMFGLLPALQAIRPEVLPAMKQLGAGITHSHSRLSPNNLLVVCQTALSLLLLVAAGLFVRTLANVQAVEMGFNPENLLLFQLNAREVGHREPEIASFYQDLQRRFSTLPGMQSVALANFPLIGHGHWATNVLVSGKQAPGTVFLAVGPGFFQTMQITIMRGRGVTELDQSGSTPVVVVNELFAKTYFGQEDPVGQHLIFGGGSSSIRPRDLEIVGVARNARYGDLKENIPPMLYVAYNQNYLPVETVTFALRTEHDPMSYATAVREIIHQADARVPVQNLRTQSGEIIQTIEREITFARLSAAFAVLALALASIGLYGSVAYNVARRTREIGVRMALGAKKGEIVWMVLREVLILTATGMLIGIPGTFPASSFIQPFLFHMKPDDPFELLFAITTLFITACLAGYLPARKASRIDPIIALRYE